MNDKEIDDGLCSIEQLVENGVIDKKYTNVDAKEFLSSLSIKDLKKHIDILYKQTPNDVVTGEEIEHTITRLRTALAEKEAMTIKKTFRERWFDVKVTAEWLQMLIQIMLLGPCGIIKGTCDGCHSILHPQRIGMGGYYESFCKACRRSTRCTKCFCLLERRLTAWGEDQVEFEKSQDANIIRLREICTNCACGIHHGDDE